MGSSDIPMYLYLIDSSDTLKIAAEKAKTTEQSMLILLKNTNLIEIVDENNIFYFLDNRVAFLSFTTPTTFFTSPTTKIWKSQFVRWPL